MNDTRDEVPPADLSPKSQTAHPSESRCFYHRIDGLAFCATLAIVFPVYLFTLAPEVTLGFSGIFSAGAYYAGVPHPPGFPLWTLYGWLFVHLLPFSNIAWRLSVSSAVAGALASALVALIVSRGGATILDSTARLRRLPWYEENRLRIVCGVVAGTAFGFHRVFWGRVVIVEPTGLAILLFAVVISLLQRWAYTPGKHRYLLAAIFVYGLDLTVNAFMAAALVGLPFLLLFVRPALGRDFFLGIWAILTAAILLRRMGVLPELLVLNSRMWSVYIIFGFIAALTTILITVVKRGFLTLWRTVCVAGLLFVLALSLYLYLPISSMTNPPMNWGYPRTVEGFFHTITRGQYEMISPGHPLDDPMRFASQLVSFGEMSVKHLGLLYFVPIFVLFFFLPRLHLDERRWMLGLMCMFVALHPFLLIMLNPELNLSALDLFAEYFIPSHLILAIWTGYGLCLLGTILGRKRAISLAPEPVA
jgi:hypothetical protein